jgi:hypothetical protein
VSERRPLRVVVFNETPGEAGVVAGWVRRNADRFELRGRRERVLGEVYRRGKKVFGDRYVVYDLAPVKPRPRGRGPEAVTCR